ncbi:MAG: hypothetical protein WA101_03450 [Minisyncoccia bacterium]
MKNLIIIGVLISLLSCTSFTQKNNDGKNFSVDYTMSIEQLIVAGHYDCINSEVNSKNFFEEKTSGKCTLKMHLINFKDYMTSEDVKKCMDKNNLRPASLKELLAFGITNLPFLKKHSVFALGSSLKVNMPGVKVKDEFFTKEIFTGGTDYFFPYIGENGFGQVELGMITQANNWDSDCYFLVFSK